MTNRSTRYVSTVFCCAIAFLLTLVVPAGLAATAKWTLRQLPPASVEKTNEGPRYTWASLSGVSCPSETLCVAVGARDTVAVSQSPTGGAARWHVVNPTAPVEPGRNCSGEGAPGPPVACSNYLSGALRAVSCASQDLCVAVGFEGSVDVSADPSGGVGAWSMANVNQTQASPTHLTGVSCPSTSLCVAVSGKGSGGSTGKIFTSTAPALGYWQTIQLDSLLDFTGVSCATTSLCVAVAKGGRIFVSSDPTGGASAWHEVGSPTPGDLEAVSCVATLLCAAGDAYGNILTSTDPTGGGLFSETNAGGSVQITGLTCSTTLRCVAVDNNADVLTSTDPTDGPGSWTFENLVPFEATEPDTGQFVKNALWGASCASPLLCVLVGANSRIFTATDPFAAPADSSPGKRARRRPRTHLVFAEGFWVSSITRRRRIKARFHFYSRDGARGFLCKRDRGPYRPCRSPLRYWAPIGRHVLRVRAIGPTGLRGPVAIERFRVIHNR